MKTVYGRGKKMERSKRCVCVYWNECVRWAQWANMVGEIVRIFDTFSTIQRSEICTQARIQRTDNVVSVETNLSVCLSNAHILNQLVPSSSVKACSDHRLDSLPREHTISKIAMTIRRNMFYQLNRVHLSKQTSAAYFGDCAISLL